MILEPSSDATLRAKQMVRTFRVNASDTSLMLLLSRRRIKVFFRPSLKLLDSLPHLQKGRPQRRGKDQKSPILLVLRRKRNQWLSLRNHQICPAKLVRRGNEVKTTFWNKRQHNLPSNINGRGGRKTPNHKEFRARNSLDLSLFRTVYIIAGLWIDLSSTLSSCMH